MRLTLVVPHLVASGRALPDEPAFARLAAHAGKPRDLARDLDTAAIAAGASSMLPIAPLAALVAGFDPGTSYVLRANPVALVAGRDDVLIAGRVDDLTAAEAQALIDALNAHFAQDGLAFHAPRPDAWFVVSRDHVPVDTTPLSQVEGELRPHLPRGEHGGIWRRWLSEMQMLLHAHDVNAAREAQGRAPVTGVWIEGGGVARQPATFAALTHDAVVVASGRDAVRDWLDPALDALERGTLDELTLLTDDTGTTLQWTASRPSWWKRLFR
jgi:hypothetical protein